MTQVLIANRLKDGVVVFLGTGHEWVERLDECSPAESEGEEEELVRLGQEAESQQEIVDPNLIQVERIGNSPQAIKMREAIRSKGPTVREDLGKQAGN